MNAPSFQQQFHTHPVNVPNFDQARSACIDAFAHLELAIYRLSKALKIESDEKGQLGQKIKKLKAAPASHLLSHENATKLRLCCDEATMLLSQRGDVVHSQMIVALSEIGSFAIFRNASKMSEGLADARVYDAQALRSLTNSAKSLGDRLDGLRNRQQPRAKPANPPSSPPPPSPAATAAP